MNDLSSGISQANLSALPDTWIEKIFQKMEDRYGALWSDRYGSFPRERVKRAWAEDLAGFTGDELKRGLEACKSKPFPPTLPEFVEACRPKLGAKAEWAEAVEQMRIRLQAQGNDRWSRPQVYWAALAVGWHDLNLSSWDTIRARWETALAKASAEPIPVYREALPSPGAITISREEAAKRVAEISQQTGFQPAAPNIEWAEKIFARWAAGDEVLDIAIDFAERTLKRSRPERGRNMPYGG